MSATTSVSLILFTLVWLISLFALALATQDVVEIDYDFGLVYSYMHEIYEMIPPNVIIGVAVVSLLLVSRYMFKLWEYISYICLGFTEKYLKTGELSDEDWQFCDRIDWHPVDDLPLKEEFIDRLKKADEGKFIKVSSIDDIFEE